MSNNPESAHKTPLQSPSEGALEENSTELDLQSAANEWTPIAQDAGVEGSLGSANEWVSVSADSNVDPSMVTMVHDPFGIQTNQIAEIQQDEDELIDEGIEGEADEDEFERLAQAMIQEQDRQIEELKGLQADEAQRLADTLAQQIVEDQELALELARETEEEIEALGEAGPVENEEQERVFVPLNSSEIQASMESILFMSDKPLSLEKLHGMVSPEQSFSDFQEAMSALREKYNDLAHGIELAEIAGGYQLRTKPGQASYVKKLVKTQTQRLSSGAMETLAIIAYRQPVLKEDIDRVRGVDSSHFVRGLMERKLIQISGRSDLPGRPILYTTTDEFLTVFGLKDLSAMPPLRELEQMMPHSETKNPEDEDPKVREIRRLVSQMKSDSTRIAYDPKEDEKFLQDIRARVGSIAVSTPTLDAQREAEKAEKAQKAAESAAAVVLVESTAATDQSVSP